MLRARRIAEQATPANPPLQPPSGEQIRVK